MAYSKGLTTRKRRSREEDKVNFVDFRFKLVDSHCQVELRIMPLFSPFYTEKLSKFMAREN